MVSSNRCWKVPDKDMRLSAQDVHVWKAALRVSDSEYSKMQAILSAEEREHALRFVFEKDRRRWVVAHGVLRVLLSQYLLVDPGDLQFSFNPFGKPSVAHPQTGERLQFNMAHSADLALYAFHFDRQVGIDVEYMRKDVEYMQLARFYFSPREYTNLQALPPKLQQEAFFLCWTRKEAYIKAKGLGLSIPLETFDVSLVPGEPAKLLTIQTDVDAADHWSLFDLVPEVNYAGALAVEGIGWHVSCWNWAS